MTLLIAGASGFIGQALVNALHTIYDITVLGRDKKTLDKLFQNKVKKITWDTLDAVDAKQFDIIINLCGHNIADSRWNDSVKKQLIDSRVNPIMTLTKWLLKASAKPHIYSASAVGIYGLQATGDKRLFNDNSFIDFEHPKDIMSTIGTQWESALQTAIDAGIPVTITRFGVVLSKRHGMLKKLSPVFKIGAGSIIDQGQQMMSWIHIDDVVAAFQFLLARPKLTGTFNLTSPNPVSQKQFAKALASAMQRPLWLKTPAFMIRLLLGEMGECLILKGQQVVSTKIIEKGFVFQYPSIEMALEHEYSQ